MNAPIIALEAEQAVLGSLLLDGQQFPFVASILKADDFWSISHRLIFEAMHTIHERQWTVDLFVTVETLRESGKLQDIGSPDTLGGQGASYLTYLLNETPTSLHVEIYAHLVKRTATRRRLEAAALELQKATHNTELDVHQVIALAEKVIGDAVGSLEQASTEQHSDVVSQYYDDVLSRHDDPDTSPVLSTGLLDMDRKLGGGLRGGKLYIVAGPSGSGKTTLMYQVAKNAAHALMNQTQPGIVVIFSREMDSVELVERMVSQESNIPVARQSDGKLDDGELVIFTRAIGKVGELPIVYDCQADTLTKMRLSAKKLQLQHGPIALIIVDYAQIVDTDDYANASSREQEVAYISRKCKQLAREVGCPVLLGSQLNDEGKVRESRALKNDADVLLIIHGDENAAELSAGKRYIRIDKQRRGASGNRVEDKGIWLYYDPDRTYFGNLEHPPTAQEIVKVTQKERRER
jgi:replicative DNA helicase